MHVLTSPHIFVGGVPAPLSTIMVHTSIHHYQRCQVSSSCLCYKPAGLLYSALFGASACNLRHLQSVMNATAQLMSQRRKFDHISDVLRDDLHWLPVVNRSEYKFCLLVYKCLHNLAPSYLTSACVPLLNCAGRSSLRSAARGDILVPSAKTQYGTRNFAAAGPRLWNSLPIDVRDRSLTLELFKCRLKTNLFRVAY